MTRVRHTPADESCSPAMPCPSPLLTPNPQVPILSSFYALLSRSHCYPTQVLAIFFFFKALLLKVFQMSPLFPIGIF